MNDVTKFHQKLQKKYPHAYSLVLDFMWTWIYNNLIKSQL